MPKRPGAVLFACNFNRVRSPMAEALFKQLFHGEIFVDSCGVMAGEDETADPFVVAVMAEIGIDIADHRPKLFENLDDDSFDLVISLTPEAEEQARDLARGRAIELEYWPTPDPTHTTGSREAILDAYREVRDGLSEQITARFGDPST